MDRHDQRNYPARRGTPHVDDLFTDRKDTTNHHIGKSHFAQADAGLGEAPPLRVAGYKDSPRADL